ncbi:hypothetical protein GOV04_05875 [Candidatus Woesearchaeota archaeon]|nr:hypothetical protein [Candidatus Woesearchaeota archaeon]
MIRKESKNNQNKESKRMVKNHLKRLFAKKTWPIKRKGPGRRYISKPNPSGHKQELAVSLNVLLRDMLKVAKTKKEVKNILKNQVVLVDGKRRHDEKHGVGLFDVINIEKLKTSYRLTLNDKGLLTAIKISDAEAALKPVKVTSKKILSKNSIQLNMLGGHNLLVKKDTYKTNNTLVIELKNNSIKKELPMQKGSQAFLIGGKKIGSVGSIESIEGDTILIKKGDDVFETLKKFAIVIGEKKSEFKVSE